MGADGTAVVVTAIFIGIGETVERNDGIVHSPAKGREEREERERGERERRERIEG